MDNIVSQRLREGELQYAYNPLDRISGVNYVPQDIPATDHNLNLTHPPKNEQYGYDPVGNRLTSHSAPVWSYNANNELIEVLDNDETTQYHYNANGQLIQKTENNQNTYYEYTPDGRLAVVKNHQQQTLATYTYDPIGRRISKTRYTDENSSETLYYLYSDEGLVGEYNHDGQLIQSYGYAPDGAYSTNPLYTYRPDFTDSDGYVYYINDHLGTPKKLITQTGRIVWFGESEAFGNTEMINAEFPNPWRFPGQYHDEETGLYYNFHRYYEPKLGRYITSDPIGLAGGINTYNYVFQNSLNLIDSLGLGGIRPNGSGCVTAECAAGFPWPSETDMRPVDEIMEDVDELTDNMAIGAGTIFLPPGILKLPGILKKGKDKAKDLWKQCEDAYNKWKESGKKYHYSDAPESSFENGLWRDTSVTDKLYKDPKEASEKLGIPVPNKVIPIKDNGQFRPNNPHIVDESKFGAGGGTDFVNDKPVPPGDLYPPIKL